MRKSGKVHVCDDGCVCPEHGTPLIYWPHGDDHACQDITCRYGHGMNAELLAEMPPLMREWRASSGCRTAPGPCIRDGAAEPCGDCGSCRQIAATNRAVLLDRNGISGSCVSCDSC